MFHSGNRRFLSRKLCSVLSPWLALVAMAMCVVVTPTSAQAPPSISGQVIDDTGAVVVGARVTVSDSRGVVVRSTSSDPVGAFSFERLGAGAYALVIDKAQFASFAQSVAVPETGAAPPVKAVLSPGARSETVVVTARRVGALRSETPQKVEVVDSTDLERSVAADITDALKKNSGVDVIQYTGALSGIGIRGFRPQFSGINKRSLLLIDGRPSGVTNLAALLLDNVERVEVLKGAASAVYGSSAMGGVVNVITRQSQGRIGGGLHLGAGSFNSSDVGGRVGGSASRRIDFDFAGNAFNQRDDIRMGNGSVRPATSYKTYTSAGRVGVDLAPGWRIDGRADVYRGRDINSPPDIAAGIVGQSRKKIERGAADVSLSGLVGVHAVTFATYRANEASHTTNVTTSNALDLPYLPYLSFESKLTWRGLQLRDTWAWLPKNNLVLGLDYEKVDSVSHSYARTGDETAPFSANSNKRTTGVYAENTLKLGRDRTVVTVGGRIDRITTETLVTPLKTNFAPSETSFNVFNPSVGLKHRLVGELRAHASAGRAFIPAEAIMLTGFTTTVVSGRTQINQGNPDLKPERSTSLDAGAEWSSKSTRFDATVFRTVVKDRFISNVTISSPPPPDPIILSVTNGLDAHISGLDLEAEHRIDRHVGVFFNSTHYFQRKERLASGAEQDILNVARNTVRLGVDLDFGRFTGRFSGRFARGRRDNDFNAPGFPIVDYDNLSIFDASGTYRLIGQHSVGVSLNNVFDAFYYEKIGYPLQGASAKVFYKLGF
jgi:vitamin B12 transporter